MAKFLNRVMQTSYGSSIPGQVGFINSAKNLDMCGRLDK